MNNPFADRPSQNIRPESAEPPATDIVALAKRALRGRWLIALAAGALLAIPAAILGYNSAKVEYASSVTVEVLEAPETLIFDRTVTDTERVREYINRQAAEIRGQRVLEIAVNSQPLRDISWPAGNEGQRQLRDIINVDYRGSTTNFVVRAIHHDPDNADVALLATMNAYRQILGERNSTELRERQFDDNLRQFDSQIANLNASIDATTAEFGQSDLEPLIADAQAARRAADQNITSYENEIAFRQRAGNEAENTDPTEFSIEQLAEQDNTLAGLVATRESIQAQLEVQRMKFGERHQEIKAFKEELSAIDIRITTRAATVRARLLEEDPGLNPGVYSPEELDWALKQARLRRDKADQDLRRLNTVKKEIKRDRDEVERIQGLRDEIAREKGKLEVERDNLQRGRVSIAPIVPASVHDDKRKAFAFAGFVFGGAGGVGLVIAFGIARRSFRFVDDIDDPSNLPPLLGTLPELDRKDPDAERIAAVSVHNLRNTLQAISGYNDDECQVIVCTSAEPGDGKTTLIQSLGASYALTGLRTIIVDLDLVGAGLSARLGMTGRRGVADLLGGLEPTKCIKRTATEKLYALPAGDANACKPEQLAHRPIQQVVDWLRERFDVVLIDTGPVLGSLEAGLTVGFADQVLLVVPRGQPDRIARAAVTRLQRVGANNIGLVFNRAETVDLKQSLSAASIGAPSLQQVQRRVHERRLDQDASIVGSIPPPLVDTAALRAAEDGTGP